MLWYVGVFLLTPAPEWLGQVQKGCLRSCPRPEPLPAANPLCLETQEKHMFFRGEGFQKRKLTYRFCGGSNAQVSPQSSLSSPSSLLFTTISTTQRPTFQCGHIDNRSNCPSTQNVTYTLQMNTFCPWKVSPYLKDNFWKNFPCPLKERGLYKLGEGVLKWCDAEHRLRAFRWAWIWILVLPL